MKLNWYTTEDNQLVIDTNSIQAMSKDEADVFDQTQNKTIKKYLIQFTVKGTGVPVLFITENELDRNNTFDKIKLLLEGDE